MIRFVSYPAQRNFRGRGDWLNPALCETFICYNAQSCSHSFDENNVDAEFPEFIEGDRDGFHDNRSTGRYLSGNASGFYWVCQRNAARRSSEMYPHLTHSIVVFSQILRSSSDLKSRRASPRFWLCSSFSWRTCCWTSSGNEPH